MITSKNNGKVNLIHPDRAKFVDIIFIISELALIQKSIGQCDVKHIMTLPLKGPVWLSELGSWIT